MTASAGTEGLSPPRRVEITTSRPDEARHLLATTYGGVGFELGDTAASAWSAALSSTDAGLFSTSQVWLPAHVAFTIDGVDDQIILSTIIDGRCALTRGQSTTPYARGDVFVGNCPQADWSSHTHRMNAASIVLSTSLIRDVLGDADTCSPERGWQPLALEPSAGNARRWRETTRFVDDLLADGVSPLLVGSAGRLLAATALTVFPNATAAGTEPTARHDGHPDTLRRAIAYIEANLDLDITPADIARAAHVTPRAVQLAFRRHLDTTPTAYLRRVRLDRARDELNHAIPGDGTTVTAVAARWGFTSSGFTRHYRVSYGELPSTTLHR